MTSVNYYTKYLKYKKKYLTLVDEINGGCQAKGCPGDQICDDERCVNPEVNITSVSRADEVKNAELEKNDPKRTARKNAINIANSITQNDAEAKRKKDQAEAEETR